VSVLIKNGELVTGGGRFVADLFVEDEVITAIGEDLGVSADETIDATGKYVMPGAVDPHTHVDKEYGPRRDLKCDDFTSGTVAAAFGGTTSIVDFAYQERGGGLHDAIDLWHGRLERAKPVIDVGFHVVVTDLGGREGILEELGELPDRGVTSVKMFMAYKGNLMVSDRTLFQVMEVAGKSGILVMVHAENGEVIDLLVERARSEGKTEPKWHAATRPALTEAEAVSRSVYLARLAGSALYVVHVSCAEALEPIANARTKGWRTWGETCSQYFFIEEADLSRPEFEGAKYVFTPPPRSAADHERLWQAVAADELSVVASDHFTARWIDRKALGWDDFTKIPNGAPGIENRVQLLHHFGVREGRITLERLVELVSTNPARLFGLFPRKGTLQIGSDADIVVFDPDKRVVIAAESQHSKIDYNMYEGYEVTGSPEVVLVRGKVVVDGDQLRVEPGHGRFLERARFDEQLAPRATTGRSIAA
jgi:dihydropyrimidinase